MKTDDLTILRQAREITELKNKISMMEASHQQEIFERDAANESLSEHIKLQDSEYIKLYEQKEGS
tara:strand:+ start:212 stop:406 length:195 start_codon:yes stop_codon:yes gene_type:complete